MELNEVEILLVEDNPNDAELTMRALKKNNLANKLYHVKDGEEALDYIYSRGQYEGKSEKSNPRLILLDLKMPKVDGLEVLRQIKSDDSKKMIPVVILTSSKEEQDVVESYQLGVNSYIVKPVEFDKFIIAVAQLGVYWMLVNQTSL